MLSNRYTYNQDFLLESGFNTQYMPFSEWNQHSLEDLKNAIQRALEQGARKSACGMGAHIEDDGAKGKHARNRHCEFGPPFQGDLAE